MPAPVASLVVQLTANSQGFVREVNKANKGVKGFQATTAGLAKGLVAAGAAGGAIAFFEDVTRKAAAFQKQIVEIQTLGLPDTFDTISNSVMGLSAEFGTDNTQNAKAFYDTISSGAKDAAAAQVILEEANQLAVGGVADLASSTKLVNTFLNAYNLEASEADDLTDSFFDTVRSGVTTVSELSSRLGEVASLTAAAGVDYRELGAALAAATKNGQSTAIAVTGLQQSIASVLKPSKEAAELAEALGIEFNATALRTKGLADFLIDLEAEVGGNQEALVRLFGSVEAYRTIAAVTAREGSALRETLQGQTTDINELDQAAEDLNSTLSAESGKLVQNVTNLAVQFGLATDDALNLTGGVGALNDELSTLSRIVREEGVGSALAALFIPPALRGGAGQGFENLPLAPLAPAFGPEVPAGFFPREPTAAERARARAAARAAAAVGGDAGGGGPDREFGRGRFRGGARPNLRSNGTLMSLEELNELQQQAVDGLTEYDRRLIRLNVNLAQNADTVEGSIGPWEAYARNIANAQQQAQMAGVTISRDLGSAFRSTLSSAVQQTQTAEQALASLGSTVAGQVVGSFAELAVQMGIVAAVGETAVQRAAASSAAGIAAVSGTTSAAAGSLAAVWGPAAVAASVATLGGASGVGLSAYLAALGAGTAATIAQQAATAATGALFGSIQGVAHDGLQRVPTDGTYLLQSGEAVLNRQEAQDYRGGRGVVINNNAGARVRAERRGDAMEVFIEDAVEVAERDLVRQIRSRRGRLARARGRR